jgi:hypothetical protein
MRLVNQILYFLRELFVRPNPRIVDHLKKINMINSVLVTVNDLKARLDSPKRIVITTSCVNLLITYVQVVRFLPLMFFEPIFKEFCDLFCDKERIFYSLDSQLLEVMLGMMSPIPPETVIGILKSKKAEFFLKLKTSFQTFSMFSIQLRMFSLIERIIEYEDQELIDMIGELPLAEKVAQCMKFNGESIVRACLTFLHWLVNRPEAFVKSIAQKSEIWDSFMKNFSEKEFTSQITILLDAFATKFPEETYSYYKQQTKAITMFVEKRWAWKPEETLKNLAALLRKLIGLFDERMDKEKDEANLFIVHLASERRMDHRLKEMSKQASQEVVQLFNKLEQDFFPVKTR